MEEAAVSVPARETGEVREMTASFVKKRRGACQPPGNNGPRMPVWPGLVW